MGVRDRDRLCEREPKLEAIDAGDGNGGCRKFQFGLNAVPDSRENLPARRPPQLHYHGTHHIQVFDQSRWLRVSFSGCL